jgi:hypothetical protein
MLAAIFSSALPGVVADRCSSWQLRPTWPGSTASYFVEVIGFGFRTGFGYCGRQQTARGCLRFDDVLRRWNVGADGVVFASQMVEVSLLSGRIRVRLGRVRVKHLWPTQHTLLVTLGLTLFTLHCRRKAWHFNLRHSVDYYWREGYTLSGFDSTNWVSPLTSRGRCTYT